MMNTTKLDRFVIKDGKTVITTHYGVLAKVESTSLGFNDRRLFTAMLNVDYGGCVQSVSPFILGQASRSNTDLRPTKAGAEFIMRVLEVFGPYAVWEVLRGQMIYVLFKNETVGNNEQPIGLAPMPFNQDGKWFLFDEWQERSLYEEQLEEILRKPMANLNANSIVDAFKTKWIPGWYHKD